MLVLSGRGQGTPALRHGIQCISSSEQTELTSASLEASGDASPWLHSNMDRCPVHHDYIIPHRAFQWSYTPCLKKNVPPLACYNFDAREWILILFGRNVTNKVGSQKTLYCATSNNLCFCSTWQNAETRKSHTSLNWIVLHTKCTCALSSWKKKLSYVMCLIASNICWGSKISH